MERDTKRTKDLGGVWLLIGELGEQGVDLEITAMLPDGTSIPVKLPKRVTLPKPPKQP